MSDVAILPPQGRPRADASWMQGLIDPLGVDTTTYPLMVIGVRGYFSDDESSVENRRNVYDDALFLYAPSLDIAIGFNGNTDPSKVRPGQGTGNAKGMAVLNPGVWYAYRFDQHGSRNGAYEALCQRAAEVTVTRDGNPPYPDRGWFGINIHRGGYYTTSSEGCQTIPPGQWDEFIDLAHRAAYRLFGDRWRERTVPYALFERSAMATDSDGDGDGIDVVRRENDASVFLRSVIRPTLQRIGYWSKAAEQLLLGTALVESNLEAVRQIGGGPALGYFQMEPRTHDDHWRYLDSRRPDLGRAIRALLPPGGTPDAEHMVSCHPYACAMARVHYLRKRSPLPAADDIEAMARYWKEHYNTPTGKGTPEGFVNAWNTAFGRR